MVGERGGQTVTDPLRVVIKKKPFVCKLEMEFFSISRNKLIPGLAMVIKIKCPLYIGEQNSEYLETSWNPAQSSQKSFSYSLRAGGALE